MRAFLLALALFACEAKENKQTSPPVTTKNDQACTRAEDCGLNGTCVFDPGCDGPKGHCTGPIPPCVVANAHCGCDGRTYHSCVAERPFRSAGECGDSSP